MACGDEMVSPQQPGRIALNMLRPQPRTEPLLQFQLLLMLVQVGRADRSSDHGAAAGRGIGCDLIAELVNDGRLHKVFVIVHHEGYAIRVWLDGIGAVNLHTGATLLQMRCFSNLQSLSRARTTTVCRLGTGRT